MKEQIVQWRPAITLFHRATFENHFSQMLKQMTQEVEIKNARRLKGELKVLLRSCSKARTAVQVLQQKVHMLTTDLDISHPRVAQLVFAGADLRSLVEEFDRELQDMQEFLNQ